MVVRPYLLATCAVLPLVAPVVWGGVRLAQSDPVLSVISATEQPLSVRSAEGVWAIALALVWFSLGYRRRCIAPWEAALVLLGGAAALLRLGNTWVDAAAMVAPLGRQLAMAQLPLRFNVGIAATGVLVAALTVIQSRPPQLPVAAAQAARSSSGTGRILADWRWAGSLQHDLGTERVVLASRGLAAESTDFWLDYVRIAKGHERWAAALRRLDIDLVVLEASDQQHQAAALVRDSTDWRVLYDATDALVAIRVRP